MRNLGAGLKIRTALLRLATELPDGFTARQLARAASVGYETARDFLKPGSHEVCYTAAVQRVDETARGRPATLHRVTEEGRIRLSLEVVSLGRVITPVMRTREEVFWSLDRLRETLKDMESADPDALSLLSDAATLEMETCESELSRLRRDKSIHLHDFETAFGALREHVIQSTRRTVDVDSDDLVGKYAALDAVPVGKARKVIDTLLRQPEPSAVQRAVALASRWALSDQRNATAWTDLLRETGLRLQATHASDAKTVGVVARAIEQWRQESEKRSADLGGVVLDKSKPTKPKGPSAFGKRRGRAGKLSWSATDVVISKRSRPVNPQDPVNISSSGVEKLYKAKKNKGSAAFSGNASATRLAILDRKQTLEMEGRW